MASYLIIRLLPQNPDTGAHFADYLNGLTITAYDSSFAIPFPDSTAPVLGTATYNAPLGAWTDGSNTPPDFTGSSIAQHVEPQIVGPFVFYYYKAVATAVIVLPDYPAAGEYVRADPYLIIQRGGVNIADPQIYYNVDLVTGQPNPPPPPDPNTFHSLSPTGINLMLPAPGLQTGNSGLLPANGNAPNFDDLLTAVTNCMNADPGSTATIGNLTMDECIHIANELLWDEKNDPIPLPPNNDNLEDLYTGPISSGSSQDSDRKQFEGTLQTYYVTHQAQGQKLAEFVFAMSCAINSENKTANAIECGFYFPVQPGVTGSEITKVLLSGPGTPATKLIPPFTVAAKYFYALTAVLPHQIAADQRYQIATLDAGSQMINTINQAISDKVINKLAADPTPDQIARRLSALGLTAESGTPVFAINPGTNDQALVQDWLNFAGPDIDVFWGAYPNPVQDTAGQLDMLLCVVTNNFGPLMTAILAPPFSVGSVAQLVGKTNQDWQQLFTTTPALLPPFTIPGTTDERIQAFIRNLRKFFTVNNVPPPALTPPGSDMPVLGRDSGNPVDTLISLVPGFTFAGWAPGSLNAAVATIFPGDVAMQNQFIAWLQCIKDAINLTNGVVAAPELQFSVMEAIWSAGFISKAAINELSLADFTKALEGTVAYPYAAGIWANAGSIGPVPPPGPGGFQSINPDGSLVNCIPPLQLSPLGPVAYLHELLQLAGESTCATPFPTGVTDTLSDVLKTRRGDLDVLLATKSNLEIQLPLIDLVNESLEEMVATSADNGIVYNNTDLQAPEILFEVLPEHATPATLTDEQGAYDILKNDFSTCDLPYSQPLDVNRTYLRQLGTSRFETMRHFRKTITEFVLQPDPEPVGFQNWLWRYPICIDIAKEYLCITPEEYTGLFQPPAQNSPGLATLYGYPSTQGETGVNNSWINELLVLPAFLQRTCLSYCEFVELWNCGFITFALSDNAEFVWPKCEPCCLDKYSISFPGQDPSGVLYQLIIFIRLWRILNQRDCGCDCRCGNQPHRRHYSFAELADICTVLQLFQGFSINPDFIRQLAAFQMLRDEFDLPLREHKPPTPGASGADRTQLLAIWSPGADPSLAGWGIARLLDNLHDYATRHHGCRHRREPEFLKILQANFDALGDLAGFNSQNAPDTWNALPTHTLRLSEVLSKIYASDFGIGELLFLFTNRPHLGGDDPFPLQTDTEGEDRPFDLPDDEPHHSLWELRKQLLELKCDKEQAGEWNWNRIVAAMRHRFGYDPGAGPGTDKLLAFGQHFFPHIIAEATHHPVSSAEKRFTTPLAAADTSEAMWNHPHHGPFRYDAATQQLWTELSLSDEAVIHKLNHIPQLKPKEQLAVGELYFQPRALLAPFAFLFTNFQEADRRLIQEEEESRRWEYFQEQFSLAWERAERIARHLSDHVETRCHEKNDHHHDHDHQHDHRDQEEHNSSVAHQVLRHLWADENRALTPWEDDAGTTPALTYGPLPTGGSYAALLGLAGIGLEGALKGQDAVLRWNEIRCHTLAFGRAEDRTLAQIPTILPSMGLVFTPQQLKYALARNGFASADKNGDLLGGAEGFSASWKGVLIIDREGEYVFLSGAPTPEGESPDFERIEHFYHWEVKLERGQKKWILLEHHGHSHSAPRHHSGKIFLRPGAYWFTMNLHRKPFSFENEGEVCFREGGFELKYEGPDTHDVKKTIPVDKLYIEYNDDTLASGIKFPEDEKGHPGSIGSFLLGFYRTSLRDIRRTYERAFKGILLMTRFHLHGESGHHHRIPEIGYMLAHPDLFAGQSYYRSGASFTPHKANFDPNFLPVSDNYNVPTAAQDDRVSPSLQRRQAMFDWWERLFDYVHVREKTQQAHPLWMLFHDASDGSPDLAADLVRYLGIDTRHDNIVLQYLDPPGANQLFTVGFDQLRDDRWMVRVWHAECWIRHLLKDFYPKDITLALPYTWVTDDPTQPTAAGIDPGNKNLTQFYRAGCIDNGEPVRWLEVKQLNDGLRQRGRKALTAYLTHMNRVSLPSGGFVTRAKELSELLLLDVETGICEKASRIDEAITAIQLFVMRAILGWEPGFIITPAFKKLWENEFCSFKVWESCKRKAIYKENWVECEILEKEQHTKAFQFLAEELRSARLTVAVPGGLSWWSGPRPPAHPGIDLLQVAEDSVIRIASPAFDEGTDLLGTPDYDGQSSWLAPLVHAGTTTQPPPANNGGNPIPGATVPAVAPGGAPASTSGGGTGTGSASADDLPLWFQAAVRLGTQFVRVAAACIPPASTHFEPKCGPNHACCCICGKKHPALIDEYYFWIETSEYYEEINQVAEQGASTTDPMVDWDRPDVLPGLLLWKSKPMVHLRWCRVHNGRFMEPNKSFEGVPIQDPNGNPPAPQPGLVFLGRTLDSLNFQITTGIVEPGYPAAPPPGFRYDLATDEAITLPLWTTPPAPPLIGGLPSFPFFGWFNPGAPVEPRSLYGTAVLVAGHLRAHCHFDAAEKWYELIYNPLINDNRWHVCEEEDQNPNGNPNARISDPPSSCCCASDPVPHYQVKDRNILLHYLDCLLQWGEALLRERRPESFQKARLIFDSILKITGPAPVTIFGKADDSKAPTVAALVPACAPINPRLLCLYMRTQDQLDLIHQCMDARRIRNGKPGKDMYYFGDRAVRDCNKMSEQCCGDDDQCLPHSPYRFQVLIQKAMEAASYLQGMGTSLLTAYEKGDMEWLSDLRLEQERQLSDLNLEINQHQWREADWQLQALRKSKEISQTKLQYYNGLIAVGLTPGEAQYEPLTVTSTSLRTAGNISVAIGQILNIIPDPYVGFPSNFVKLPIGSKMSMIFNAAGTISNVAADIINTVASLGLTKDGWARRLDEWKFQVSVITVEIEEIARQILAAERRRDISLRQLNNQEQTIESVNGIHAFNRDKFTDHALYLWLRRETAGLFYQMYELTLQYAQQAQRAFNFERGHTVREFLPRKIWNDLHEGLLCGERIHLALRQMEKAYYDENRREYELTKHISARIHFPKAYLRLQKTGICEIEIPEWMFDQDYPGQYMRRIKNVTMTIPCVAGPYTGIHCRLTLLSSSTRVKPDLLRPVHLCCDDHRCNNGYEFIADDPRLVKLYAATEGIATSAGLNESGTFEVNFRDERYLPFEFMGAISRWRIELPKENNYFDMETLSDVILHLHYTSREGGENLRRAAVECAKGKLPGEGLRFFDVRKELSDAWQLFTRLPEEKGCRRSHKLGLRLTRNMFPFLPGNKEIAISCVEILFEAPCAEPSAHHLLEFMIGRREEDVHEEGCDCEMREVTCIASAAWPGLFHGILELHPADIDPRRSVDLGTFRFPQPIHEIRNVYLIYHYHQLEKTDCLCQTH